MNSILEAKNLTRNFGGLVAVNNITLSVNKDEIFGLIGPNGAGKTTLFNLITGLIPPSKVNCYIRVQKYHKKKTHEIATLGIARTFQNIRLFGELSALENVIIGRHLHTKSGLLTGVFGIPPAPKEEIQSQQKALELLELVGLQNRAEEQAKNFSYGEQRRLEIARALALEPQILLLDEPAAGMNPSEKHQLSDFIKEVRDKFKLTIILIEHHVPLVMGLCDRIAVLNFGQLIALDKPAVVRSNPAVIEAYLGNE
ncbi:MAG: ABC transporter ATP-binding protein [Calothrix sp. CSU_2_0]|nr:ABC transporter ATP-binding protein [Calothrix sp. CSU_2_0]